MYIKGTSGQENEMNECQEAVISKLDH